MPRFIDKTGMTFGQLTVLSRAENQGKRVMWNCICSCGKECCVRGDKLTQGYVDNKGNPSCGHLRIEHVNAAVSKNLVGEVFGRLTVLEELPERDSRGTKIWRCKCSCGKEVKLPTDSLTKKDHPTRSCGCLQKEKASEIALKKIQNLIPKVGENINNFIVKDIKFEPTNNGKNESWIFCECPFCGNQRWFQTRYIKSGDTKSCGCIGRSAGEEKIARILSENNIKFEQEKIYEDLKFELPARFDFYLPQYNLLIEYDGEQHFKSCKFGNITDEEAEQRFIKIQQHDTIKNEYCYNNNIPLIRIPYTHYNDLCLEDLLLETSQFIVK